MFLFLPKFRETAHIDIIPTQGFIIPQLCRQLGQFGPLTAAFNAMLAEGARGMERVVQPHPIFRVPPMRAVRSTPRTSRSEILGQ